MLRCDELHVVQGGSENPSEALSRTASCYHPPVVEYLKNLVIIRLSTEFCASGSAARKKLDFSVLKNVPYDYYTPILFFSYNHSPYVAREGVLSIVVSLDSSTMTFTCRFGLSAYYGDLNVMFTINS